MEKRKYRIVKQAAANRTINARLAKIEALNEQMWFVWRAVQIAVVVAITISLLSWASSNGRFGVYIWDLFKSFF